MRFVIYGAGAIGGVIGGRLHEHGHEVVLIARGAHYDAMVKGGLTLESPNGSVVIDVPVVEHPGAIDWREDDAVCLGMKSQDTAAALGALVDAGVRDAPIVSLQNGVDNERRALRSFPNVYGVCVMCPAAYLEPGIVQAFSTPTTGILDVGRFPSGVDEVAGAVATAFTSSTFVSEPRPDITRWKYGKLLMNLTNAIDAACGPANRQGPLAGLVRDEGVRVLRAAGIDFVDETEDRARRGDILRLGRIGEGRRPGASSWQSLARGTGSIESDYLNGEIVLLGRLHGVPTPANELLQDVANRMARDGTPPGSIDPDELLAGLPTQEGTDRG